LLSPNADAPAAGRAFTAAVRPDPAGNVVGVGIGEKVMDGKPTGVWALRFFVRVKFLEAHLDAAQVLPKTVDGLPTDVEQTGLFRRLPAPRVARGRTGGAAAAEVPNPRAKIRPAQPGCSVGFRDPANQFVMAGTFGALVADASGSYVLSNNHVLADENRLAAGAPIFQPGLLDGGKPDTDQIAELTRFVTLQAGVANQVDCAVARALKTSLVSRDILQIGPPAGATPAALDMLVHKFGRTTGYRAGRVTSVDTDVAVQYETGRYTFESQIIIVGLNGQGFSDAGDSGSLILERDSQRAVGLLFAGSSSHTIANHITDVLQALGVTLA
jgi:S1-C subfamily serine protease